MNKYDWVLIAGIIALTAVALWFQVRYYRLVDDLFEFLTAPAPEKETEDADVH